MRLSGKHVGRCGETRPAPLVKARQDQLLLARVGVDVADREDALHVGLEALGVDGDLPALDVVRPQLAIGPRRGLRPKNTSTASHGSERESPPPLLTVTAVTRPSDSVEAR